MANYNELNSHNLYEIATELSDLLDELHSDRLPTKLSMTYKTKSMTF